jgi:vancomycin resistance protein YoaR
VDTSNDQDTVQLADDGHPRPGAPPVLVPDHEALRASASDVEDDADAPPGAPGTARDGAAPDSAGGTPGVHRPERAVARPRRRRWTRWLVAIPLVLLAVVLGAWGVDTALASDQVARNTELAGVPVGGMTRSQLDDAVDELATTLPETPVVIDAGDLTLTSTAGALGIGIDTSATAEAVWDTGRSTSLWRRPIDWLGSIATPRSAAVVVEIDEPTMTVALATLEGDRRTAAIEPSLAEDGGAAVLAPGVDGVELRSAEVIEALPETLGDVSEQIEVTTERTVVPPAMPDAQIQALVDQANTILGSTITVAAGDQQFELAGANLLGGFLVDNSSGSPRLSISEEVIGLQLAKQQPELTANPTGVRFDIQGGVPVPIAGSDVQICCGDGAAAMIVDALLSSQTGVTVPTRAMTAAEGVEWARGLGVREVVGEFTTPHKCCESRVTNIHRIADLTRGVVIAPGATFSVNGFVGRRTTEKGFVEGGVIENGEFTTDIGGGVSQYATTLFNAAFFGGLDIPEYKMHSKYISRYPYGREATLAYPSVDLKIHNNTPYGVVIWPSYTNTSITVQLWSTRFASGDQTAQSRSSGCGSVTTERTRTFVDGHTETDTFNAAYDCD